MGTSNYNYCIYRIITNKIFSSQDKYKISTAGLTGTDKVYDPNKIKLWPNPYFIYNPEESGFFNQEIHFTHLPEDGKCTIRIFDIAGNIIRTLHHDNGTQYEIWNVRNHDNWKIASGMYIAHIETDQGEKILKLAIVQPSN